MIHFSIKDLESFSGIKAHTIRTWEQRFSFLQPKRSQGLRRTYDTNELKLILIVSFLNKNGYKVSHIARMDKKEMTELASGLSDLHHLQERAVNELICCMVMMNYEGFTTVLESCEMAWGIDVALTEVILPFLQKTGLLHQREHRNYDTNLLMIEQSLKQKIITGIEQAGTKKSGQTALFFLSKKRSEHQLLYLQYELKIAGFAVLYISSPALLSQLTAIASVIKPAYIITSAGGKTQSFDSRGLVEYLDTHLPESVFLNLDNKEPLPFQNSLHKAKEPINMEVPTHWLHEKEYSCLFK